VNTESISIFHRLFDKTYPALRFLYETIRRQPWFSQITPTDGIPENLWLGGGPDYPRDLQFMLNHDIKAVINIRAEREDDTAFYDAHGIEHMRYPVPDVSTPSPEIIEDAVRWISGQVSSGKTVLIHCAKGRGRSATLLAGYLMRAHDLTYDQAAELIKTHRQLTKLEERHRQVLHDWQLEYPDT
jgi:protein tyrosine/serine phosphatase